MEVQISKKCKPLWREAHLEVKRYKTPQVRAAFGSCDVEKVHAVEHKSEEVDTLVNQLKGAAVPPGVD